MVIGVISDTHRYNWLIEAAVKKLEGCDMLIHLGDNVQDIKEIKKYYSGTILNIKGNCDFAVDVPGEIIQVIESKKFFLTHGHRYDVKADLFRLRRKAIELEVDIVLYGHTHVSKIDFIDGIWFVNPGSPSIPRDGFYSVATIDIKQGKVNPSIRAI